MTRWHRWQLPQSILILTKGVVVLVCHPRTLRRRRQEDYTDPVQEGEAAEERQGGGGGGTETDGERKKASECEFVSALTDSSFFHEFHRGTPPW